MAVQQNKSQGIVANTMTITKLVNQSKEAGTPLKMIKEPMLLEPVAVGLKKSEDALKAKVNEALYAMDKDGEIDALWSKWLGADTDYKLTRDEKVQPDLGHQVHADPLRCHNLPDAPGACAACNPASSHSSPSSRSSITWTVRRWPWRTR